MDPKAKANPLDDVADQGVLTPQSKARPEKTRSKKNYMLKPLVFLFLLCTALVSGMYYSDAIAQLLPEKMRPSTALNTRVAALETELSDLATKIGDLGSQTDSSSNQDVDALRTEIFDAFEALQNEMDTKSVAPALMADGTVDLAPILTRLDQLEVKTETQEESLGVLNDKLAKQSSNLETQNQTAQAAVESIKQIEILTKLRFLIESGQGFAEALADLREVGISVPEILQKNASGIVTLDSLRAEYQNYALDAMQASIRASGDKGAWGRIKSEVSARFVSRSTKPIEGQTPNAILSRAEAKLGVGDLEAALSELSLLPSISYQAMQPWIDKTQKRLDVIATLDQLESGAPKTQN